jgi:hypothetical protein
VDSFGEQGKQYDACFQIGEFHSDKVPGTAIVILVPLKTSPNPGEGGKFVNAFANKIPNILGQQPDPLLGYPDVPAQTGATWDIAKAVDVKRPYYTWVNSDGTRVIVMAEPILVSAGDMTNIQRLPVTPPQDVIHEIGSPIFYKPAPPVDAEGKPIPCPKPASAIANDTVFQPPVKPVNKPAVDTNLWLEVLLGIIGTIAMIIGVWFGVKLASGPVGDMLRRLGDSLGSSLAGGYGALRRARASSASALGIGARPVPPPRTADQIARAPPAVPVIPTGDISVRNPMIPGRTARTVPPNTTAQPDVLGRFARRTRRNLAKTLGIGQKLDSSRRRSRINTVTSSVPSASSALSAEDVFGVNAQRKKTPIAASIVNATEPFPDASETNRLAQPAGTGLADLGMPTTPAAVAAATEPFPDAPAPVPRPARKTTPISDKYEMYKNPMIKPKRRNIAIEPEETSEERIQRKAEETALPRRPGMPTGVAKKGTDTGIFGSPATRGALGVKEKGDRNPDATIFGGKKRRRRNRLKTGRKV